MDRQTPESWPISFNGLSISLCTHQEPLTQVRGKLQPPVLPPVGVAVVAEPTVLVHIPPLVPARGSGHMTALTTPLAIGSHGDGLLLVWDGGWHDTRGSSFTCM